MEPAMAVESVHKHYGETVALDGVSLSVDAGEIVALVGPNGAGKTTLVRVLTGTSVPDEGSATLLGAAPTDVDRNDIGVLPQAFAPPDRLTARELLAYYAGLYEDPTPPETVLDTVGVAAAADTRYGNLSGGQQRRVCLGAALVNDPQVLVLDEPTTGIDPAGRRTVRERILSLADRGRAVLVTTHDMDEAERIADRVALLADGRVRATGTPRDLVETHGGSPRVIVDLVDPTSDTGARAVTGLESRGFEAVVDGDRLVVEAVAPTDLSAIVDALDHSDVDYEGLQWREPSLEDAYMQLAPDADDAVSIPDGGTSADDSNRGDERDSTRGGEGDSNPDPSHDPGREAQSGPDSELASESDASTGGAQR